MCGEPDPVDYADYEELKPARTVMVRRWPNLDDFDCGCDFEDGERCLVCGHVGETPHRYHGPFTKDRRRALAAHFVHEAIMRGPETFTAAKRPWSWKKVKGDLRWWLFAY